MTDEPPIIINEDAAIDSAFFGSHAGRSCYARAHRCGWVLVVRQAVAQREPPVMLRVWAGLNGCRMTMRAAWHCGSVAPIRADAALQGCAAFRIALLAPLLAAAPVRFAWDGPTESRTIVGMSNIRRMTGSSCLKRLLSPDGHVQKPFCPGKVNNLVEFLSDLALRPTTSPRSRAWPGGRNRPAGPASPRRRRQPSCRRSLGPAALRCCGQGAERRRAVKKPRGTTTMSRARCSPKISAKAPPPCAFQPGRSSIW